MKREGGIRRVMNEFGLQRREDGDGGRKYSPKHICLFFFICTLLTEMPQSNKQHLSVMFFLIKTNPPTVIYSRACVNKAPLGHSSRTILSSDVTHVIHFYGAAATSPLAFRYV